MKSVSMIFDEIDSGVSGEIASSVAKKLYRISRNQQTICITHQPIIAAMADQNLIVEKIISDGLENSSANYLVRTYGKQSDEILNKYFLISGSDSKIRLAKAQLWFAVTNESVYKLQDFFIRRTGMFLFEPESVKKLLPAIAEEMKNYLQWDTQRCGTEMEEMENLLKKMVTFE